MREFSIPKPTYKYEVDCEECGMLVEAIYLSSGDYECILCHTKYDEESGHITDLYEQYDAWLIYNGMVRAGMIEGA